MRITGLAYLLAIRFLLAPLSLCGMDNSMLFVGISEQNIETVKKALYTYGSGRIQETGTADLYTCINHNWLSTFKELLAIPFIKPNNNLSISGHTLLGLAYQYPHSENSDDIIQTLHIAGERLSPLIVYATMHSKIDFVKELLHHGARTDAKDNRNNTALHNAAYQGNIELMHILIEAGADPNAQNIDLLTPLHLAATMGKADAVGKLLQLQATDQNLLNINNDTPLMMAIKTFCKHQSPSVISMLLFHPKAKKSPAVYQLIVKHLPSSHLLHALAKKEATGDNQKGLCCSPTDTDNAITDPHKNGIGDVGT